MTTTDTTDKATMLAIASKAGITPALCDTLAAAFVPLAEQAAALIAEAEHIVVIDATQVTEIRQSRAARLKLKGVRVEIENARRRLKEEWLRPGQAIDDLARYLRDKIEPVESRLDDQEKIAERKEAERKAAIKAEREAALAPFGIDTQFYALGDMPEGQWTNLLAGSRAAHEAKVEAARKAEADRLAAEAARRAEEALIVAENERLKLEAAAREADVKRERERVDAERRAEAEKARLEREAIEAKAKAEREKAEGEARREREAREALEAKARAEKAEADRKAAAEAKALRAAERAPDKAKLAAFATAIRAVAIPAMKDANLNPITRGIEDRRESFAAWVEQQAESIG